MKEITFSLLVLVSIFNVTPANAYEITNPFVSHIANGGFECWSNGTVEAAPDSWNKFATGSNGIFRSGDSVVGNYSLCIKGNSAEAIRGHIYQGLDVGENITHIGCWVKITGMTQGALEFNLRNGTDLGPDLGPDLTLMT